MASFSPLTWLFFLLLIGANLLRVYVC